MKNLRLGALFCALFSLNAAPAVAGIRTYLSTSGNDANACTTESAPCRFFLSAIEKAGSDGEVVCLNSGFFGVINITLPIAIHCNHHIAQTGINFNAVTLSAGGIVILDGIDIDMREFTTGVALNFSGTGTLILRNSSIRNGANGVRFAPTGNAKLVIADTTFESHTAAGVLIEPQGAGLFAVNLDGVKSTNNLVGVTVLAGAGENVNLEIHNSLLAQNANYGFFSTGVDKALIDNSSISHNGIGVRSVAATSVVRVNRSVFAQNNIAFSTANGGSILSYGNNAVNSLTAGGGPTGTVGLQ